MNKSIVLKNRINKLYIVLAVFMLTIMASTVYAKRISIPIGSSYAIPAKYTKKVLMVKENIVEVVDVSDTEVTVAAVGEESAATQIIIWDVSGKKVYDVEIYDENDNLQNKFKNIANLPDVKFNIFHDEVVLSGKVDSKRDKDYAERIAEGIVKNKPIINFIEVRDNAVSLQTRIENALQLPDVKVTVINPEKGIIDGDDKDLATDTKDIRVILQGFVQDQNDYMHLCETMKAFIPEKQISNLVNIKNPIQVVFQAYILQVTKSNVNDLGITWQGDGKGTLNYVESSATGRPPIGKDWDPLKINNLNRQSLISATVQAWENRGKVKVVANPNIIVYANATPTKIAQSSWKNEEESGGEGSVTDDAALAYVNVSQKFYFASGIDQSGSPIYDSADASLKLSIRDMFVFDNQLKFTVFAKQEEPSYIRGNTAAPDIMSRSLMTTLNVRDQETVVLGGLINKTQNVMTSGVPLLSKLPLIGNAFKHKSVNQTENELIILLTPKISKNAEEKAEDESLNKFDRIPVPHRSERLEILNKIYKRIQTSFIEEGE